MASRPTLWLTRPREESETLAAELAAHGIACIISPVMRIELLPSAPAPTDAPDALLITSRHAAHALASLPRNLPVFCVGEATAKAAQSQGFTHVIAGESDLPSLLPTIVTALPPQSRLCYLAGEEVRHDVAQLLESNAIHVAVQIVYRAVPETILSPDLCVALAQNHVNGACFFSPRSAAIACDLFASSGYADSAKKMHAFCLSPAVAERAVVLPWQRLHTCLKPTQKAMLQMIVSELTKTE
jgi:uroporphyrinogen-III synthase